MLKDAEYFIACILFVACGTHAHAVPVAGSVSKQPRMLPSVCPKGKPQSFSYRAEYHVGSSVHALDEAVFVLWLGWVL